MPLRFLRSAFVFETQGEIDATLQEPLHEHDTFIVAFDVVEKRRVRQIHQADIEAMKVAVALESDSPSRFVDLTDGIYLFTEAGKIVYSISFSMNAEASVSTSLSDEAAERINRSVRCAKRGG